MRWSGGIGLGDRLERVEPDDQLDPRHADAPRGQRGRAAPGVRCSPAVGRGGRAGPVGVDGLVALGVGQRRRDVGRQRHLAEPRRAPPAGRRRRAARPSTVSPASVRWPTDQRPRRPSAPSSTLAGPQACGPGGPAPPSARCSSSSGSSSSTSAAPPVRAVQAQPGRDHPGVVDHDEVAGREQLGEVADVAVLGAARRPAVDQQAGRVAGLDRASGRCAPAAGRSRSPPSRTAGQATGARAGHGA